MSNQSIVLAEEMVDECYAVYGALVNTQRAIPSVFDGMKAVQRRLTYAAMTSSSSKMQKCADVVGRVLATTHPHGDVPTYNALVNMINDPYSTFEGQGNFGFVGLTETGAAAMRYTECRTNRLAKEVYAPLVAQTKFVEVPHSGFLEPQYFPTLLPYAMLNGANGIGVGCRTSIPPFTLKSMVDYIESGGKNYVIPGLKRGNMKMSDVQIERINSEGTGICVITADVTMENYDGRMATVIRNVPDYLKASMLLKLFQGELMENLIMMADVNEENGDGAVVIQRRSNVRRISDQEIFDRVVKSFRKTLSYSMIVAEPDRVYRITPGDWLDKCFNNWTSHSRKTLESELNKYRQELRFEGVREQVLNLANVHPTVDKAKSALNYEGTKADLDFFFSRPLSRFKVDDTANIKAKLTSLEFELQDIPAKSVSKAKTLSRILK